MNTRLVDYPNGAKVPADEPAVAAARRAHLNARNGASAYAPAAAGGYGYSGPLNMNTRLVDYPNGAKVPADEPAVAAARRAHLNARNGASASSPAAASGYGYSGSLNMNTRLVDYPNGAKVPAEEPAVAAARAAHLNEKAEITLSAPYGALVSHANGAVVPADEPAVVAARAAHLNKIATAAASTSFSGLVSQ